MYVYFAHRKGHHTTWHQWCYTWCRPEANWRAWTQGTPCIHGQLLHKPYPFYLSATAWVWTVWYCSCQQARDVQGSHTIQAEEGRHDNKWGKEGYVCTQMAGQAGCCNVKHHPWRLPDNQAQEDKARGMEEIEKPTMVEKYNMYMGGVDKRD